MLQRQFLLSKIYTGFSLLDAIIVDLLLGGRILQIGLFLANFLSLRFKISQNISKHLEEKKIYGLLPFWFAQYWLVFETPVVEGWKLQSEGFVLFSSIIWFLKRPEGIFPHIISSSKRNQFSLYVIERRTIPPPPLTITLPFHRRIIWSDHFRAGTPTGF